MSERADTTRRGGSRTWLEDRRGFALPAVLLLLMVLSTITVFFLVSSSDQQRAGRAMRESAHSFYAADAGVNMVLSQWQTMKYDTLVAAPGDSVDLGWVTLDEGSTYRAKIYRVDGSQGMPFYSLSVTGVGPPPFGGQRTIYVELYGVDADICCLAAAAGGGRGDDARLDETGMGGVTVNGNDSNPTGWGSLCTDPLVDKPGITWQDASDIDPGDPGDLLGDPASVEDASITPTSLFDWGSMDYDDLASMATIVFADGADPSPIGPLEAPPGTCKKFGLGSDLNWGSPLDPTGPCGNHFPIIHVTGDMRLRDATGQGQGILLVDGELRMEDTFDWYGIIIAGVKDPQRARFEDSVSLHGAVIVGGELRFNDGAQLQYSSCVVRRALEGAGLLDGQINPMAERAWRQVMD